MANYINYVQGRDTESINYGGNILSDYRENRPHATSAYFLDGLRTKVQLAELGISWQFWPGWHLEGSYLTRSETAAETSERLNMVNVGVRVNTNASQHLY